MGHVGHDFEERTDYSDGLDKYSLWMYLNILSTPSWSSSLVQQTSSNYYICVTRHVGICFSSSPLLWYLHFSKTNQVQALSTSFFFSSPVFPAKKKIRLSKSRVFLEKNMGGFTKTPSFSRKLTSYRCSSLQTSLQLRGMGPRIQSPGVSRFQKRSRFRLRNGCEREQKTRKNKLGRNFYSLLFLLGIFRICWSSKMFLFVFCLARLQWDRSLQRGYVSSLAKNLPKWPCCKHCEDSRWKPIFFVAKNQVVAVVWFGNQDVQTIPSLLGGSSQLVSS